MFDKIKVNIDKCVVLKMKYTEVSIAWCRRLAEYHKHLFSKPQIQLFFIVLSNQTKKCRLNADEKVTKQLLHQMQNK